MKVDNFNAFPIKLHDGESDLRLYDAYASYINTYM